MFGSRAITRLGLVVALSAPFACVVACGGSSNTHANALPKAGDMPDGGEWTGVFFSPTYGYLHLVKEGTSCGGKWRNAAGDKWGEMHGEVSGNLFHFEWAETKIGMVGPSAKTTGRGYFVYSRPPAPSGGNQPPDEINGEWGLGTEQTGVSWSAVKQKNMKPDPDSVVPDETQQVQGGGWDEGKKKKGSSGGDSDKGGTSDGWN